MRIALSSNYKANNSKLNVLSDVMIKIIFFGLLFLMVNSGDAQNLPGGNISPKTALIKLTISKRGDDYTVVVRDVTVINSDKKTPVPLQNQANSANGLVCFILDQSNAIIDSIIITEPLVTRYEYPKADGTIGSKVVALDEKDVVIRSRYNPGMEYLRVLKFKGKANRQSLVTLKLPKPGM